MFNTYFSVPFFFWLPCLFCTFPPKVTPVSLFGQNYEDVTRIYSSDAQLLILGFAHHKGREVRGWDSEGGDSRDAGWGWNEW